jgi:hypothetical protein
MTLARILKWLMSMKKTLVALIILTTSQITAQIALAKLDIASTQPLIIPMNNNTDDKITSKDVEKIIPTDLKETNDMNSVAARIADRGLQAWFNSPQVKESFLGQTANTVQKRMVADISIKGSNEPQAVEHKVSMQLMALQAAAKIQYTGFLNAVFNYDARAAESMIEFSEKVFNKDLFVNHTSSSKEDVSSVGIKWGW